MAESHGEFDLVAFEGDDAAFVVAVASGARAAQHLVSIGLETRGELVHGLCAAKAEGDMRVAGACEGLRSVLHTGACHDLEAGAAALEAQEVRAEVGDRVVVEPVRRGAEVGDEEAPRGLQVVDVQGDVVDGSFLLMRSGVWL